MKTLADILKPLQIIQKIGTDEHPIRDIQQDSRKSTSDDVFVAISGTQVDGHQFIDIVKAKAIVCEEMPNTLRAGITYVQVPHTREAWALMASAFYDYPAQQLSIVGITGTNGKTSVATLLYKLFSAMGRVSGLISTIHIQIDGQILPATHTTPDPKEIHHLFRQMVDAGCTHCFMEVSSHALHQKRVWGIPFRVGIFTNITHDHLDYHGTFDAYIQAKKILFDHLPPNGLALINIDDRNARVMVQNTSAQVKTFATKRIADYQAVILENTLEGLRLKIGNQDTWFRLLGSFNAYNLVTAYATAVELGFDIMETLTQLSLIEGVSGRFQVVRVAGRSQIGIVDYAHTPDALLNVLETLQDIVSGKRHITTVVGCGGDRDKTKRPIMGKIAAHNSHRVILTSDNPRSESPELIIEDMYTGISNKYTRSVLKIANRKEAIRTACIMSGAGDIILVAGKGHETYQEIKGVKYDFDDKVILETALRELE